MKLQLDEDAYVTHEQEVTLSWDVSNLDHISLIIDQLTNIEKDLDLLSSLTFTTQPKGSFSKLMNRNLSSCWGLGLVW